MQVSLFNKIVLVIGRITISGIKMLGTGFLVSEDGKVVTAKHVINDDERNLVILLPKILNFREYQDTTDTQCKTLPIQLINVDVFKDIAILKSNYKLMNCILPIIGSFDDVEVGKELYIFGFPHCTYGRRVLTQQNAELGAKILLECETIKSEHAVVNIQSRPGQSGSMVYAPDINKIVGMLIGAYIPLGSSISLGGINPQELNQTTHCVSAKYIKELLIN